MEVFHTIKKRAIDLVLNSPKKVISLFILLLIALTPFILTIELDFSSRVWYSETDPLLQKFDQFEKRFGNDDSTIIIMHSEKGIFTEKNLQILKDITEKAWHIKDAIRVESLSNFEIISGQKDEILVAPLIDEENPISLTDSDLKNLKNRAINNKLLLNYLISKDGKTTTIHLQMIPFKTDYKELVEQTRDLTNPYKEDKDLKFFVIGNASLAYSLQEVTTRDVALLFPIFLLFATLFFWKLFKNWYHVFLPYGAIITSTLLMLGVQGVLHFSFNVISAICSQILFTVAISDIIHLLASYRLAIDKDFSPLNAVKYSLHKNFYPTFLTSITTAMGFLSFATAKVAPIAELGILVAFGVIFAWIATIFFIGPLMVLRARKNNSSTYQQQPGEQNQKIHATKRATNFSRWIYKHSKVIVVFSLFASIYAIYGVSQLVIDLDPFTQVSEEHPLIQGADLMQKQMHSSIALEIMIYGDKNQSVKDPIFLQKVDKLNNWLLSSSHIIKTTSIIDILKELNQAFLGGDDHYYKLPKTQKAIAELLLFYSMGLPAERNLSNRMTSDEKTIRLTVFWDLRASKESLREIEKINKKAKELQLNAIVTGKVPMFHDLTPYVVSIFFNSFFLAFGIIALIMIFVLRSFKLGLLALIPNIFPIAMGGLVYYFLGKHLDMSSVLVASVCFGIAVDDTIHFIFDYKNYRRMGKDTFESISQVFTTTFPSLLFTTVVIVIGFSVFIFASYLPNQHFGIMVAIILSIALIADITTLPALLFLIDKEKKKEV